MSVQCSICLSSFKDPSCLPCGHLFCKPCIVDYVNSPQNTRVTTKCPDCRTPFNTTMPDLTYLPEKYHPFIAPALRRVYVDIVGLEKKLDQAEKHLKSKKDMEELLLKKCEAMKFQMAAHQLGEHTATIELKKTERKLKQTQAEHEEDVAALQDKLRDLELRNRELESKNSALLLKTLNMIQRRFDSPCQDADDEDEADGGKTSPHCFGSVSIPNPRTPQQSTRAMKPLPRRLHVPRRFREDSDSSPPQFVPPKRPRI